ncbi:unnamed protein product, partial [Adineta ricciae]
TLHLRYEHTASQPPQPTGTGIAESSATSSEITPITLISTTTPPEQSTSSTSVSIASEPSTSQPPEPTGTGTAESSATSSEITPITLISTTTPPGQSTSSTSVSIASEPSTSQPPEPTGTGTTQSSATSSDITPGTLISTTTPPGQSTSSASVDTTASTSILTSSNATASMVTASDTSTNTNVSNTYMSSMYTSTSTPIQTTNTTITTTVITSLFSIGSASYEYTVTQTVNLTALTCWNISDPVCQKNLTVMLSNHLSSLFSNIEIDFRNCNNVACNISYTASLESYKRFNHSEIQDFIVNRTSQLGLAPPTRLEAKPQCRGYSDVSPKTQGACVYCGTERPCADFDESTCDPGEYGKFFVCRCDRTKHFFRTNYDYDGRCERTATITWEQMLALCLLLFFILLLLLALLLFLCRRRRKLAKQAKREPEVLANAPQKPLSMELSNIYNSGRMHSNDYSTIPHLRRAPLLYSVPPSNDYVYQPRTTQNYTYPSRNYPYTHGGVPSTYLGETDDRLGVLRDLVNEYTLENGSSGRVNLARDLDDDEIYV